MTRKLILLLMVFSIFLLVALTACQQSETESPHQGAETPQESEAPPETDVPEGADASKENEENQQSTDSDSKDRYEKLDINPKVSIRENIDYARIDKPSADFELEDINGNKVKLSDYRGQIVFLNFWGTWCPPCRAEMPHMEAIHQEYAEKGVVMLGVSSTALELRSGTDAEKAKKQVKDYVDNEGYTFTFALDPDNKVLFDYEDIFPTGGIVPVTYMIDREGIVRYIRPGAFQGEEQLEAFIASLDG